MQGKENLSYCDVVEKSALDFFDIFDARRKHYDLKYEGKQSNVKEYVDSFAASMFDNPQKIDAFLIFSKETSYGEFCGKVQESMFSQIRKNWETISPSFLSYITAEYAYSKKDIEVAQEGEEKDFLIAKKEFMAPILDAYFKGPKTMHERVDSLYNFTFAAVANLMDDDTAILQATKIIAFEEQEILSRESKVFQDWVVVNLYTYYDDNLIQKALIPTNVVSILCLLTGLDTKEIVKRNMDFTRGNHEGAKAIERRKAHAFRTSQERLGVSETNIRRDAILCLFKEKEITADFFYQENNSWPYNLILDRKNPLFKRFLEVLENRFREEDRKKSSG